MFTIHQLKMLLELVDDAREFEEEGLVFNKMATAPAENFQVDQSRLENLKLIRHTIIQQLKKEGIDVQETND